LAEEVLGSNHERVRLCSFHAVLGFCGFFPSTGATPLICYIFTLIFFFATFSSGYYSSLGVAWGEILILSTLYNVFYCWVFYCVVSRDVLYYIMYIIRFNACGLIQCNIFLCHGVACGK
jgi:hypothetical protein